MLEKNGRYHYFVKEYWQIVGARYGYLARKVDVIPVVGESIIHWCLIWYVGSYVVNVGVLERDTACNESKSCMPLFRDSVRHDQVDCMQPNVSWLWETWNHDRVLWQPSFQQSSEYSMFNVRFCRNGWPAFHAG